MSTTLGTISSSGIGSGLDVKTIVQQLVSAEGAPKSALLDASEARVQSKLSALGTLRSALATFQSTVATLKDIKKFQGRQVSLSTPEFITATATTGAVPGTYSIEVQQLATAQKLQSSAHVATAGLGIGTLHITAGGSNYNVLIDSTNNTVAGIATAINSSAAGAKVQATVITGTDGARLAIAARATGTANAITITQSDGDDGLASLVYPPSGGSGLTQLQQAFDAQALVDGASVTSSSNTLSGAVAGVDVTLNAKNASGETTQITVGYNRSAAQQTINQLVTSYNAVIAAVASVASYDTQAKQGGPLFGDVGVTNLGYQLRRVLTSNVQGLSSSVDMLGKIGITAQLDGKLSVDSNALNVAFTQDFDAVGNLFAAEGKGIAVKLDGLLAPYLGPDGVFASRTTNLQVSIKQIGKDRDALNAHLVALQTRYTKQFNALDTLLSQMQGTSNFLTQQLSKLPGAVPVGANQN